MNGLRVVLNVDQVISAELQIVIDKQMSEMFARKLIVSVDVGP